MMPRPLLRTTFNITYRKIPILAIGKELYCDTSIILEALEHFFPIRDAKDGSSLYPSAKDGRDYRSLARGFASYWTDRPLFRVTTGLIPSSVWRTRFGTDRAALIGHNLDADKLEKKVSLNLSNLDLQLSLLEPQLREADGMWMLSTATPSLADISLFYQLQWGRDIAAGKGIENLTGGGTQDTDTAGTSAVFNQERYPAIWSWFQRMETFFYTLPSTETIVKDDEGAEWVVQLETANVKPVNEVLIPTPRPSHTDLDEKNGLLVGVMVSVAPDDTGRDE